MTPTDRPPCAQCAHFCRAAETCGAHAMPAILARDFRSRCGRRGVDFTPRRRWGPLLVDAAILALIIVGLAVVVYARLSGALGPLPLGLPTPVLP